MSGNRDFIVVEADEKIEIYNRNFSSVPLTIEFGVLAKNKQQLAGSIEIIGKKLWFEQPVKTLPLKNFNQVHASTWDTFMKVYVKPACDIEISLPKRQLKGFKSTILLITTVIVMSAVVMVFTFAR